MRIFSPKKVDSTAPTPITQEQYDWLGMCILGAYDLYCLKAPSVPNPSPIYTWITSELALFKADAQAIYSNCSAPIQTALTGIILGPSAPAAAQVRTSWKNLLINLKGFGNPQNQTFGAWLKNLNVTSLVWPQPSGSIPSANDMKLSFYTVLFFCDLESLFVGVAGNLESYWALPPGMDRYSADVLQGHYYVQAKSPKDPYNSSDPNWIAYQLSLTSVATMVDCADFWYGPYYGGYTAFLGIIHGFASSIDVPKWTDPAVPYISHSRAFVAYTNYKASVSLPTVPPAPSTPVTSGLNDLGNYLDGAASVANQLLVVKFAVKNVFLNNNYTAQKPALTAAANTTAPIPNPSQDSLYAIVSDPPSDVTSPYAGIYMSLFFMDNPTPTPPPYGILAYLHFCVDLGNYTFMLTDGDGNPVYSNSPLTPPGPLQPPPAPIPFTFMSYDGSHDGESGYTMTETDGSANPGTSQSGVALAAVWAAYMADETGSGKKAAGKR